MADADHSYDFRDDIPRFIAALKDADLVVGNRFAGTIENGAMPGAHGRYVGNPFLSFLVKKKLFRIRIGDIHCGVRANPPRRV